MAKGDHIYIQKGLITHHGIDCGDGTVIHHRGKPAGGRITKTSYSEFAEGKQVYVKPCSYKFSADEIVRRAERRLHEQNYNLFSNNCEHFAMRCTTGQSNSQQVDNSVTARHAGVAAAGGLLLVETTVPAAGLLGAVGFTTTAMLPPVAIAVGAALAAGAVFVAFKKLSELDDKRH
ncbi:lecithin retinol acyltransferase family protein [Pleurocapsa sp. FMAR1]|uniref:lecithin retinol acyltransferase family protein n=1 Tax=Pleurocapsa sp. FMAR1 TaxID=3040204 RepID=UPI0029C64A97|nr:lecithin retinol acyltransferase family protein [Pleurocapsa sp. FMAR1]